MQRLDDIGATIERLLDRIELGFGERRLGPPALGAAIALGVVAGGLAAFILAFAVLVGFFA